MMKGSIQQDIAFIHISAPNTGAPGFMKQILRHLKKETDSNRIIMGDLALHLHQRIDYPDRNSTRKHWPSKTH